MPAIGRRAARRDANEPEIVEALETAGATVVRLSAGNVPDLLVGYMGVNLLFEIKAEKGKLRPGQERFIEDWCGQVTVVRSIDDALRAIGAIE